MSAGSLCWNCSSYWFYFWFSSRTRKKGSFLSTFWNENLKISDQLNTRFEGWVIKVEEKTWHHEVEESNGSLSSLTWSLKERAFSEVKTTLCWVHGFEAKLYFTGGVLQLQPEVTWNKMFSSSPEVAVLLFSASVQICSSHKGKGTR